MEYFIMDKTRMECISQNLVITLDIHKKNIHVARFYPEIYKQLNSKYMSAACFYLLVHHFAQCFHLDETYHIDLETTPSVFHGFYEKLKDFHLHITTYGLGNTVNVLSEFAPVFINTSQIHENFLEPGSEMFIM